MILQRIKNELDKLRQLLNNWPNQNNDTVLVRETLETYVETTGHDLNLLEKERDTRQSQELQMELALCYTEDAVCVTNREGEIRLVNPAFEQMTGYSGMRTVGTTLEIFWKDRTSTENVSMELAIKKGNNWQGQLEMRTEDGQILFTETCAVPIVLPSGEINHHVFTIRDITRRVKMESQLSEQKNFLEKILNLSSNIIIVLAPNGEWALDNLAAKTLLTDMGKTARARLSKFLLHEVQEETTVTGRKIKIETGKQRSRYFLLQAERMPAQYLSSQESGDFLYLINLSEITELEAKNREILVREKALLSSRLEQSLAQEELANGFVYQMSQPINVAKAVTGRIRQLLGNRKQIDIKNNVIYLQEQLELMDEHLEKFRLVRPIQLQKEGNCSCGDMAEALRILYHPTCNEKSIDLNISVQNPDAVYPIPYEHCQTLLIILMDNALEAEFEKELTIRAIFGETAGAVFLTIEDSGKGITEENKSRLFEPFFSTKKEQRGLSLTFLFQIVDKGGGSVEVDQSPLGGARFQLRFLKEDK